MIDLAVEIAFELFFVFLKVPRSAPKKKEPQLPPVCPQHLRGQRVRLERWSEKYGLAQLDGDTWQGKVGRFDVRLRTFMRSEGALPLHLEVDGVRGFELPACGTASTADANWKPVFLALPTLEHIRRIQPEGLEFRFRWNTQPTSLATLFELLEERFQGTRDTYR